MLESPVMDGRDEMKPTSTKLTYDDFVSFPDDGLRHELIDGEHYVTPSPATVHQRLVGRLHAALFEYLAATGRGEVFLAPFDVVLSNHDVVEPDLLVILATQSGIVTEKHVRGAPAIVVEVLSPGTKRRDETLKRRLYDRAGVREYWMVDSDANEILVCHGGTGGELSQETRFSVQGADVLMSALLPQFSLPLARVFDR